MIKTDPDHAVIRNLNLRPFSNKGIQVSPSMAFCPLLAKRAVSAKECTFICPYIVQFSLRAFT